MATITRGTTPTLTLTVSGPFRLSEADRVVVTLEGSRSGVEASFEGDRLAFAEGGGASVATITLTQEETLAYQDGETVMAQLRARKGDIAVATGRAGMTVLPVLLDGEV